jgi:predicted flap endonuclease-1-like 5' DNA nuclease
MCILCILLPVLVGLICALLGYLLGRLSLKNSDELGKLHNDLDACRKEREKQLSLNSSFKSDIDSWRDKYNSLQSDYDAYKLKFTSAIPAEIPFDAVLAATVFRKKVIEDDLKIVEGIGPKIEKLFHNEGIRTWKILGETTVEKCLQILDKAGESYRIHNPATWPKQCELAYLGKWNELKEWQDKLTGGKESFPF